MVNSNVDPTRGTGTTGTAPPRDQRQLNLRAPHEHDQLQHRSRGHALTITSTSDLPPIDRQVTINGYSQGGPTNTVILIQLNPGWHTTVCLHPRSHLPPAFSPVQSSIDGSAGCRSSAIQERGSRSTPTTDGRREHHRCQRHRHRYFRVRRIRQPGGGQLHRHQRQRGQAGQHQPGRANRQRGPQHNRPGQHHRSNGNGIDITGHAHR